MTERVTIFDRGPEFASDTSISFSQISGEPGPVFRTITLRTRGEIEILDGFPGQEDMRVPYVASVDPDSVRMMIRFAIDAGVFNFADSIFAEPEEGTLDGPSHYHIVVDLGRRSKSIQTDGSDRDLNKLIGLSNVADHWAWERLPKEKRWRWYGPAWTIDDLRRLK